MSKLTKYEFLFSTMKGIFHYDKGNINLVYNRQSPKTVCFFPITWDNDFYYFGEMRNPNEESFIQVVNKKNYETVRTIEIDGLCDIHQMVCYDNKLYICNTGKNCLLIYCLNQNKVIHSIHRGTIRKDINHINGVYIYNNHIYTTHLNSSQGYKSDVFVYDINTYKHVNTINIGQGIHNLYINKDRIYTCSSYSKEFLCMNVNHSIQSTKFLKQKWFWLRGLATDEEYMIVGGSQIMPNEFRHSINRNMIYLFDKNTNLVEEFVFNESNCGPIYDIRLLKNDKAHP
jgi:hypothetical protein